MAASDCCSTWRRESRVLGGHSRSAPAPSKWNVVVEIVAWRRQRCFRSAVIGRRLQYRDGLEDDRLLLQPGFVVRVVTERKLDHLVQPHVALCRVGSAHGAAI